MEFKASKNILADAEFRKHSDEFDKYNECLSSSDDPMVKTLAQWEFRAHSEMWAIVFEHLLSLDREIYRLNKELVFKEVTNDEA